MVFIVRTLADLTNSVSMTENIEAIIGVVNPS